MQTVKENILLKVYHGIEIYLTTDFEIAINLCDDDGDDVCHAFDSISEAEAEIESFIQKQNNEVQPCEQYNFLWTGYYSDQRYSPSLFDSSEFYGGRDMQCFKICDDVILAKTKIDTILNENSEAGDLIEKEVISKYSIQKVNDYYAEYLNGLLLKMSGYEYYDVARNYISVFDNIQGRIMHTNNGVDFYDNFYDMPKIESIIFTDNSDKMLISFASFVDGIVVEGGDNGRFMVYIVDRNKYDSIVEYLNIKSKELEAEYNKIDTIYQSIQQHRINFKQ